MIKDQKNILEYTRSKIENLFKNYSVPAHGLGHVLRVEKWAKIIANKEKSDSFLSQMAALFHDIGRIKEGKVGNEKHHELSYLMCQKWFKEDEVLKKLSKDEKLEILYAVRYHWNDGADKYFSAVILRDADKLDALGKSGLQRALLFYENREQELLTHFRYVYGYGYELKTKTAQRIAKKNKMLETVLKFYYKILKNKIEAVEL